MLEVNLIKQDKDNVAKLLEKRNFKDYAKLEEVISYEKQRIDIQQKLDKLLQKSNLLAKQIGDCFKNKEIEKANQLKESTSELKAEIAEIKKTHTQVLQSIRQTLLQIPNVPHQLVPKGTSENDNVFIYQNKVTTKSNFKAIPHWEIASKYDIIDFETGAKITGSGFPVFKGKGAKLVRGLINFFLAQAEEKGYKEYIPPIVVNNQSALSTGQLPDKEGQMYHVNEDDLYLIPTAEVPLTNIFRDLTLSEMKLPKKITAYSPCFRREAGSYGKDVRGLNRLHQFDKVEIVQICKPEDSYKTLDEMVAYVKIILDKLGLPYRILRLCGGDLGFTSAMTYDFEVYSIAQEKWLEVSSISNFETFQATRLNCKYKNKEGKKQLVHTLNGSALALPRIIAALLENFQTKEGIIVPEAIRDYVGMKIIN